MSTYLSHLTSRVLSPAANLQPRLGSLFEPASLGMSALTVPEFSPEPVLDSLLNSLSVLPAPEAPQAFEAASLAPFSPSEAAADARQSPVCSAQPTAAEPVKPPTATASTPTVSGETARSLPRQEAQVPLRTASPDRSLSARISEECASNHSKKILPLRSDTRLTPLTNTSSHPASAQPEPLSEETAPSAAPTQPLPSVAIPSREARTVAEGPTRLQLQRSVVRPNSAEPASGERPAARVPYPLQPPPRPLSIYEGQPSARESPQPPLRFQEIDQALPFLARREARAIAPPEPHAPALQQPRTVDALQPQERPEPVLRPSIATPIATPSSYSLSSSSNIRPVAASRLAAPINPAPLSMPGTLSPTAGAPASALVKAAVAVGQALQPKVESAASSGLAEIAPPPERPTINISIGRIEVRAAPPRPAKAQPSRAPAATATSLSNYLRPGGQR